MIKDHLDEVLNPQIFCQIEVKWGPLKMDMFVQVSWKESSVEEQMRQ